jgi:hypothetical protein
MKVNDIEGRYLFENGRMEIRGGYAGFWRNHMCDLARRIPAWVVTQTKGGGDSRMNIRFIGGHHGAYPCNRHPALALFVRQIAHSFARQGVRGQRDHPASFHRAWLGGDPFCSVEEAGDGARSPYIGRLFFVGILFALGKWNSFRLTVRGMRRSAKRVICEQLPSRPDALYGHFMYPAEPWP